MKKPVREHYFKPVGQSGLMQFDKDAYYSALDMYCDSLEKALDKACERLRDFDEMEQLNHGIRRAKDIEEWKEWAMTDGS